MTEILGSERFQLMRDQFMSVFTHAPSPTSIEIIHTDHAMKMNNQLAMLYRQCMVVRQELYPAEQASLDYLPGILSFVLQIISGLMINEWLWQQINRFWSRCMARDGAHY